jgi:hypothetical protein
MCNQKLTVNVRYDCNGVTTMKTVAGTVIRFSMCIGPVVNWLNIAKKSSYCAIVYLAHNCQAEC